MAVVTSEGCAVARWELWRRGVHARGGCVGRGRWAMSTTLPPAVSSPALGAKSVKPPRLTSGRPYASRMTRALGVLARRARALRERGATAVEYAFIVSLIAAVVVVGVVLVGRSTTNNFSAVTSIWP